MLLTRRKTRTFLRAVIPLLAVVWASLPMHQCQLTVAAPAQAASSSEAVATTPGMPVFCQHHVVDDDSPTRLPVACSDLVRAVSDLRPAAALDMDFAYVSWDARWLDSRLLALAQQQGAPRPPDDGRWRYRPLHLQKSVLLI